MCHLNQSKHNSGCSCHGQQAGPAPASSHQAPAGASAAQGFAVLPLAIVTIPMQVWEQPYEPCKALKSGTVFPSLELPFYAKGGGCCG